MQRKFQTIFKVTFRVKSGTAYGKYAVSAKLEFEDASSQKSAEIVNANITVGCSHNLSVKDPKDTNLASKATCTSPAKYYYLCSKCNQKGTKTYEHGTALGHTGGTPSCSKKAICTRCSKEYGNLLEHTFGEWNEVEPATEEKEGLKERVCSGCNKKETEKIAVLGHTHKYQEILEFDAICSGKGLKKHICSCGDSYDEIIPAKQHSYSEYEILVNPTETTDGYKQKKCTVCGDIELEKIEKLTHEHKYSDNYYTNKEGHYKECGCGNKTQVEAHTFGEAVEKDGYIEYSCTICGYTKVEVLPVVPPVGQSLTIYYAIIGTEALIILLLGVLMIALKKKKK